MDAFLPDNNYDLLLQHIKEKIRSAQIRAIISANREMLLLYWEIGTAILEQQKHFGWGGKVVDRLGEDLRREYPQMDGLSKRNLMYMHASICSNLSRFPNSASATCTNQLVSQYHIASKVRR